MKAARRLWRASANVLKLSSNENPMGPSEAAKEAFGRAVHELHRYPSTDHLQACEPQLAKSGILTLRA